MKKECKTPVKDTFAFNPSERRGSKVHIKPTVFRDENETGPKKSSISLHRKNATSIWWSLSHLFFEGNNQTWTCDEKRRGMTWPPRSIFKQLLLELITNLMTAIAAIKSSIWSDVYLCQPEWLGHSFSYSLQQNPPKNGGIGYLTDAPIQGAGIDMKRSKAFCQWLHRS